MLIKQEVSLYSSSFDAFDNIIKYFDKKFVTYPKDIVSQIKVPYWHAGIYGLSKQKSLKVY